MDVYLPNWERTDIFGVSGAVLGGLATLYMLFLWQITVHSGGASSSAIEDGVVREQTTTTTETVYHGLVSMVRDSSMADPMVLVWPIAVAVIAVIGGVAAWKRHRVGIWASVLALSSIAVLGLFSVGLFVVPSAAAMLLAAVFLETKSQGDIVESTAFGHATVGPSTPLLRYDVLALFIFLAGPITLLQIVDVDLMILTVLAFPSYLTFIPLTAIFTVLGFTNLVGTTLFWVVHVAWVYLLSVVIVLSVRSLISRLQ